MSTQNSSDPIAEIKNAERLSKEQKEKATKEFFEKIEDHRQKLEEKVSNFELDIKTNGLKKLETVKEEASQLLKSKLATTETEKNKIIAEAEQKKPEATESVINSFTEYIKT